MIDFKTIKQQEYKNYDTRYIKDIQIVHKWLSDIITDNGLFFSFRWYLGRKLSRADLINRIHIIFNKVFPELLGSHWIESYKKHFTFLLVEEVKNNQRHAHLALGLKTDRFNKEDVIKTLIDLESIIKMEISIKEQNSKKIRKTNRHHHNMVISPIYDVNGVSEYISKEFKICFDNGRSFVNIDNLIYPDDVFPVKTKIKLSAEVRKNNERIIKKAALRP